MEMLNNENQFKVKLYANYYEKICISKHDKVKLSIALKPSLLEEGLRVNDLEFKLGQCQFDLIGRDKENNFCMIEILNTYNTDIVIDKVHKYKGYLNGLLEKYRMIFVFDSEQPIPKRIENILQNYDIKIISFENTIKEAVEDYNKFKQESFMQFNAVKDLKNNHR